jgi:heat shock protein HslJ
MRSTIFGYAAIAVLIALSGCATTEPTPIPSPTMSLEQDWLLYSGSDSLGDLKQGDEGAIRMTIAGNKVTGQICNSWGGGIAIDGSSIAFGPLYSTEMYCETPDGIMDRESRFLTDLALVTTIELVDGKLHLSGDGVDLEFGGSY